MAPINLERTYKNIDDNTLLFMKIQTDASNDSLYLEEINNVLFGWNTPMYVAKIDSTKGSNTKPKIIYDCIDYVRSFL